MLTEINIQNFRCFQTAHFKGFKQFNLLGGQNNAGKTALLEAIYVLCADLFTFNPKDLYKFRKIDFVKLAQFTQEKVFSNLFFNQNMKSQIKIEGENHEFQTRISIVPSYQNLSFLYYISKDKQPLFDRNYNFLLENGDFKFLETDYIKLIPSEILDLPKAQFIPTDYRLTGLDLVKELDNLVIMSQEKEILLALQLIDKDIEEVRSFASNLLSIYIKKKGENFAPIAFLGDAVNKMVYYILMMMQAKDGILLIDEIENGLHHSHQVAFWELFLKMAKAFNVQIFATSHSLEMIRAFNQVAQDEKYEGDSRYFEMARHAKTQQIISNPMDMEMLEYEIIKNQSFRGE